MQTIVSFMQMETGPLVSFMGFNGNFVNEKRERLFFLWEGSEVMRYIYIYIYERVGERGRLSCGQSWRRCELFVFCFGSLIYETLTLYTLRIG